MSTTATTVIHPDASEISVRDLSDAGSPLVEIRFGGDVSILVTGKKLDALDALHESVTKAYELLALKAVDRVNA